MKTKLFTATIVTLFSVLSWIFVSRYTFAQQSFTGGIEKEAITSFDSELKIEDKGKVLVTETLVSFFPTPKHGIFRDIQTIFTNQDGEKLQTPFHLISVTDQNGKPYQYTTSDSNDGVSIKIGSPSLTLTGSNTYVIKYEVSGAIEEFSDHDELYWNVTGNQWQVPIQSVRTTVSYPNSIPKASLKAGCFTGIAGSTESNCTFKADSLDNTVIYTTNSPLDPSQGITVALSFEKGHIPIIPKEKISDFGIGRTSNPIKAAIIQILLILYYLIFPIAIIFYYFKKLRDPKINTAIPALYDFPQDGGRRISPAEAGTIEDKSADSNDITATIVDLAIRGYLKIVEVAPEGLNKIAASIIPSLQKKEYKLTKSQDFETKDKYKELQSHESGLLDFFFNNKTEVSTNDIKDTFYKEVLKIKKQLYRDLVLNNFFTTNPETSRGMWIAFAIMALFTLNFPLAVVCFVIMTRVPKRTEKCSRVYVDILGLKKFLSSQERQLEFQEKNWYMFEKLLPYAVAFKVTDEWAKRFADLGAMPKADWYVGSDPSFNYFAFAAVMNSFNSTVSAASISPTRSGSGFGSGFGGGGSSGGGFGGGGGGGSW